jgi:hypothetical protein
MYDSPAASVKVTVLADIRIPASELMVTVLANVLLLSRLVLR